MLPFAIMVSLVVVAISVSVCVDIQELELTKKYYEEKGLDGYTGKSIQYIFKNIYQDLIIGIGMCFAVWHVPLLVLFFSPMVFLIVGDVYKLIKGPSRGLINLD